MTIKYKKSVAGWIKKIDIKTGKPMAEFNEKNVALWDEMQAWIEAGGVIEEQYTPEELAAKEAEETEKSKTEYQRLRKSEYPDFGEQLDYIYHNGVDAWKNDIIKTVKDKYPKPS